MFQVLSLLLDYCQLIEKASVDEVYADLTPHAAALVFSLLNEGPPSDAEDGEGAPRRSPPGGPPVPSPTTQGPPGVAPSASHHIERGAPEGLEGEYKEL